MKKKKFWSLMGLSMACVPLSLAISCNATASEGHEHQNSDKKNHSEGENPKPGGGNHPDEKPIVLGDEIQKLTYTSLSNEDFKNLTITDPTILNESVAEQLGFVLPDTVRKCIEKAQGEETAKYVVKVSKAIGSLDVTYNYRKTSEQEEKRKVVTEVSYHDNMLSIILEKLKSYNTTTNGEEEWKNISVSDFDAPIDGEVQAKTLQIKKIEDYANELNVFFGDIKAYIRKDQNEDTIKYVVVKTLNQGQKIVEIGDPVKVSPTPAVLIAIRNELKVFDANGSSPLTATVSSEELRDLEYAKAIIVPDSADNKFDWDAIKTTAPDVNKLPETYELQDQAAIETGKIEVEKVKGETTLHWYISYVDANGKVLTDKYVSHIKTTSSQDT